jgi:hypothetical protein
MSFMLIYSEFSFCSYCIIYEIWTYSVRFRRLPHMYVTRTGGRTQRNEMSRYDIAMLSSCQPNQRLFQGPSAGRPETLQNADVKADQSRAYTLVFPPLFLGSSNVHFPAGRGRTAFLSKSQSKSTCHSTSDRWFTQTSHCHAS